MSKYDDKIMKAAKQVWAVMQGEAFNRGMAITKDRNYGDGRVIINTVGAFIKGLNKERGWGLDENQIDLTRRYLKATGNVVVLNKLEQYQFRIFIRETWHEGLLVTEPVTKENPSRADKISPHDAGEDREPAPVEYRCSQCGKSFASQQAVNGHMVVHKDEPKPVTEDPEPHRGGNLVDEEEYVVSEHQAAILTALNGMGGRISHEHGRVSSVIQQATGLTMHSTSNTSRSLYERGYIDREVRGKRTYRMWLTKKGKQVAENIDHYRGANYVVADFLASRGRLDAPKTQIYATLSRTLGINQDRVGSAVRSLVDDGLVELVRESEHSLPHALVWKGDPQPRREVKAPPQEEEVAPPLRQDEPEQAPLPQKAEWLSNGALLTILRNRLDAPKVDPKMVEKLEQMEERLSLIEESVKEVMAGKTTPLKALGDIEAALSL